MTFRQLNLPLVLGLLTALTACGGGGYGGGGGTTYTVGGTLSGLTGSGLVLQDNGGDNLALSANGAFTFATKLPAGTAYSVSVLTQPTSPSETCLISNGSGTVGSADVTSVTVACTVNAYTVGGTVTGLTGLGLVLRDNGGDSLSVASAGAFTFATAVASGSPYRVSVFAQPTSPSQNCLVTNGTGSGSVTNAKVTSVAIVCIDVGRFAYTANTGASPGSVSGYRIDASTGALTPIAGSPFAADSLPQSVALDPSGKFAYVPNPGANHGNGNLSAYTIDASAGALTAVAGSPFAGGTIPLFITIHPSGKFAYLTNEVSNNVWGYGIDAVTGALSPIPGSPFAAGAVGTAPRSVTIDPSGKFAYVPNLDGNTAAGTVLAYTIDTGSGALSAVSGSPVAAGTAPWVVTVDPTGKFAYVANVDSGDISAYTINPATGALSTVAGSPYALPGGTLATPYAVTLDPAGRHAYVADFNSNDISAYTIDSATGALSPVNGSPFAAGLKPFIVAVDPSGSFAYAANQGGNNVSAYAINAATGALTAVTGSPFATGGSFLSSAAGAYVNLDPSGKFAYVANVGSNNVSAYTIDAATGALTAVAGSPFMAGQQPRSVSVAK